MSKKGFVADGKEFTDKAAFRDYMIATHYSFKNKYNNVDGPFVKHPGDINSNPFEISDCEGCQLVVMDITEQVQIDQLKKCKVFIGACSSSLFIRDCTNCIFYVCCRQLRIRDCVNCIIYSYSQSEIHIELSNKLRFAPFIGGYAKQEDHFKEIGFKAEENLWYDIFDHNDPDKTGDHWSLLPSNNYGQPWFPDGSKKAFIPITEATSSSNNKSAKSGQVGESFGFHQLVADNKNNTNTNTTNTTNNVLSNATNKPNIIKRHRNIQADVEVLGDEVSLLVVYAEAQEYNLLEMLSKGGSEDGIVSASLFIQNLLNLTILISTEADESTRKELETATSESSLKSILELCRNESPGNIGPSIDVKYFLKLCKKKYLMLTEDVELDPKSIEQSPSNSLTFTVPTNFGMNKSRYQEEEEEEERQRSQSQQISKSPSKVSSTGIPPHPEIKSSLSISLANISIHSHSSPKKPYGSPSKGPPVGEIVPASPYDEIIQFSDDDNDNDSDSDSTPERNNYDTLENDYKRRYPNLSTNMSLMNTSLTDKKNNTSAFGVNNSMSHISNSNNNKHDDTVLSHEYFLSRPINRDTNTKSRPQSAPRSSTKSDRLITNIETNVNTKMSTTENRLLWTQAYVEEQILNVVKQADLYHKIQVHLGFIDAYTMAPPRGSIVVSKPRSWLSQRDVIFAFQSTNLKLTESQVQILVLLVNNFAQELKLLRASSVSVFPSKDGKNDIPEKPVVKEGMLLNAQWLKKYLATLRLKKPMKNTMETKTTAAITRRRSSSTSTSNRKSNATNNNSSNLSTGLFRRHSNAEMPISKSNTIESNELVSSRVIPIQWDEWLGMKVLSSKSKQDEKPKEFRRALAGLSYNLSKNEMNSMLTKYQIIPDDILSAEIQSRVRRWVLDIDGRRDFQHEINLELRKWQNKEKKVYNKLPKDVKKTVSTGIKNILIHRKTEELKSNEKSNQGITLELYWKYATECADKNYQGTSKWGEWLRNYRVKSDELIKKIHENTIQRQELSRQEHIQNESVIPIQELASVIHSATSSSALPASNALELRKSFVSLCKEAAKQSSHGDNHGIANYSVLVTKGEFDRHLDSVLTPIYKNLPEELKRLAKNAKIVQDEIMRDSTSSTTQFYEDRAFAANRAVELETQLKSKKSETFNKWLKEKLTEKQKKLQIEEETKKKTSEKKESQLKAGEEAYKKWLKLRKKNKYFSKLHNTSNALPGSAVANHKSTWRQDFDSSKGLFGDEQ